MHANAMPEWNKKVDYRKLWRTSSAPTKAQVPSTITPQPPSVPHFPGLPPLFSTILAGNPIMLPQKFSRGLSC